MNFHVLQTPLSKEEGQDKYMDDSEGDVHGTAVAARALGSKFGVAKEVS